MKALLIIFLMAIIPTAYACADFTGEYRAMNNDKAAITLVQKDCTSIEIRDPRESPTLLILDGTRRAVKVTEEGTTYAISSFERENVIGALWEIGRSKSIRKLSRYELTNVVIFQDQFFFAKSDGRLALLFEELWVRN